MELRWLLRFCKILIACFALSALLLSCIFIQYHYQDLAYQSSNIISAITNRPELAQRFSWKTAIKTSESINRTELAQRISWKKANITYLINNQTKENYRETPLPNGSVNSLKSGDFDSEFVDSLEIRNKYFENIEKKLRSFAGRYSTVFPNVKTNKFMIYSCSDRRPCGGWGDRLRGLYSVYMLSLLQNRTFGVDMKKPCPIEMFLRPAELNWKVSKEFLTGKSLGDLFLLNTKAPPLTLQKIVSRVPKADVIYVTFNEDYVDLIKSQKPLQKSYSLSNLSEPDLVRTLYYGLFQYNDSFLLEIKRFFEHTVGNYHLVSAHIRIGDSRGPERIGEEIAEIWDFLKKYRDSNKYKIFIASDTQRVKDEASKLFPGQYVGLPGTIIHTDMFGRSNPTAACAGLKLSLLDHAILARSHTLLLTDSGFGVEAARIRHTSDNLYCFKRNIGIISCQREILESFYNR